MLARQKGDEMTSMNDTFTEIHLLPFYMRAFMPGKLKSAQRGGPTKDNHPERIAMGHGTNGNHGTTTCVVDHDPSKRGFDPVSWLVITIPVHDEQKASSKLFSTATKLTVKKGLSDIEKLPIFWLRPGIDGESDKIFRYENSSEAMIKGNVIVRSNDLEDLTKQGYRIRCDGAILWVTQEDPEPVKHWRKTGILPESFDAKRGTRAYVFRDGETRRYGSIRSAIEKITGFNDLQTIKDVKNGKVKTFPNGIWVWSERTKTPECVVELMLERVELVD